MKQFPDSELTVETEKMYSPISFVKFDGIITVTSLSLTIKSVIKTGSVDVGELM